MEKKVTISMDYEVYRILKFVADKRKKLKNKYGVRTLINELIDKFMEENKLKEKWRYQNN